MTKLAVAGATGLVGRNMLETLDRKGVKYDELVLFSSARSAGQQVEFQGNTYTVQELTEEAANEHYDYVLMSAGGSTSEHFSPIFEQAGAIVIDNSSQWRMTEGIDLIVPEVNEPVLERKIIANPNCSTIQSVVPLKVLQEAFGLNRVAYTTYQAVSGSGVKGKQDLAEGANGKEPEAYPHPIYNNVLPHIDVFLEDGYTKEEQKMIDETRKILKDDDLKVTATCVRVPVQDSHSVHMSVTLNKDTSVAEIQQLFEQDERVVLVDNPEKNEYPLAIHSTGKDEIFVGRIRKDDSLDNTFHVWCTSDNLLKGAALNAVQILEQVMSLKGVK
ncbi:aspartate-semialdehyde dehydrogenase [Staphylococcus gallinarum]|jgi:aspartate-semialdehyde dehydrogenase|uniref:Aspartate-semialdehyde dehydrogenase n=1 Tax=Staphylococcus gallinarum TaxID=1293 RepID=A0A418HSC0_STAGA|nr:aspartate-semialdehyde dehydrogenase [Staphylococcus gallinarum]MCD8825798.1 aspartate-semialdehyde dehydrogenase [Staphylococcus gallinarum]MCD8843069.1 aspartate-semialdehyde dehydrogenase [Staphylococcus gallinarum]MCD8898904.1 aspartate-semialdehyde dehydrogenase [Staphylococcus gallinarum]MCD8902093.1 aspartate-semialdehyde dehydrogenase [Staphylococcus gallinarum]MCD8908984.1 aspartate-semialdehyde dehydrogenase [Staphylococcus gallinarum]